MSGRFLALETALDGVVLLQRIRHTDQRGHLSRLFCAEELSAFGWSGPVAQINETGTTRTGTVRGLHYQKPPYAECKLITCMSGEILDIAVDLRPESPTYLQNFATRLSADNARSLLIPAGFAHGFQTLSDDVRLVYAHSAPFTAEAEAGLHALDPQLAIAWALPVANLSDRDRNHPFLPSEVTGADL